MTGLTISTVSSPGRLRNSRKPFEPAPADTLPGDEVVRMIPRPRENTAIRAVPTQR